MDITEPLALALIGTTAVRVFAPDVARGLRRLLGAGVRVGAAELTAGRSLTAGHLDRPRDMPSTDLNGAGEQQWGSS
ncbi:hypothetical protein OG365_40460 (plasmid) [Streptomyces sp. NBC_00853]|uniref:hypothetical protein n=1 Tax=Streptomyces TaxID=1883 RepID=UPI002F90A514|nr:hypothetical protein OG365_40460 [Streptomyces sp. NBC_00853]WTB28086.1 hypothetical protein OG253_42190 [Streptomyces virginiae]